MYSQNLTKDTPLCVDQTLERKGVSSTVWRDAARIGCFILCASRYDVVIVGHSPALRPPNLAGYIVPVLPSHPRVGDTIVLLSWLRPVAVVG